MTADIVVALHHSSPNDVKTERIMEAVDRVEAEYAAAKFQMEKKLEELLAARELIRKECPHPVIENGQCSICGGIMK